MMNIETFRKLFVHRNDIFAEQDKSGAYFPTKRLITDEIIDGHLKGKRTLGLYQLDVESTVKWACIDIDITKPYWSREDFDFKNWQPKLLEQSEIVKKLLKDNQLIGYTELSGNKGLHVWVFLQQPVSAQVVKDALHTLFDNMPKVTDGLAWELFPKQAKISGEAYGNLVKAPLGIHRKTDRWSSFIDILDDIKYATEKQLRRINSPIDAVFHGCEALRNTRDAGLRSGYLDHTSRLVLAYTLLNLGDEGEEGLREIISQMDDYDAEKTTKNIERIKEKGYRPITCGKLQSADYGICPGPCANIGSSKSPVAFYYRHKKIAFDEDILQSVNKLTKSHTDGKCYYEKKGGENPLTLQISNFVIKIKKNILVDDGLTQERVFRGKIKTAKGREYEFELPAQDYASNEKLTAYLYKTLGNSGILIDSISHIRDCVDKWTRANNITIRKTFGYNEELTRYYSPSVVVTADGVRPNDELIIDLKEEEQAGYLDLDTCTDQELEELKKHFKECLLKLAKPAITHTALAHTFLPIIDPFLSLGDKTRYIYFLRGESGKGKSFLLKAFQNCYGAFTEPVSWTSTPNSIGRIGYFYKDALFLVDDFKKRNIPRYYDLALALLQNYADLTGKSRMRSDLSLAKTYSIRGFLAISGEDSVAGEASNLARMITIEYTDTYKDLERGLEVGKRSKNYNKFTARYIQWVLQQPRDKWDKIFETYLPAFYEPIKGEHNDMRIARNMSLMMTSYESIAEFLWPEQEAKKNCTDFAAYLRRAMVSILSEASEELASERFWQTFEELLATGVIRIQEDDIDSSSTTGKGNIAGFKKGGHVWLIIKLAYELVQRHLRSSGEEIKHTLKAVQTSLYSSGKILDEKSVPRKMNGRSVRVVRAVLPKSNVSDFIKHGTE